MSSKNNKRKKNNTNDKKVNNIDKKIIEENNDMDECDKILEQLDEMEKKNDISSKVKNLIQKDKEAIKQMNENLEKLEADDDLDYLDDETESDEKELKIENELEIEKEPTKDNTKKNANDIDEKEDDEKEDEANLDFFAGLNKEDRPAVNDRIRKNQPKRLINNKNNLSFMDKIKLIARNNTKNFLVGTAIAFLFIVLVIALALDAGNQDKSDSSSKLSGEFIEVDTVPMIDAISNYYAALESGDINAVKSLMTDSSKVSDEDITDKCDEAKAYAELVGTSFMITDCYVQNGLKKNEYIAYMKFQIKFNSIETPCVGIFTCYLVDMSTKDKVDYRVSIGVNDKSSDIYKYILKMSSCKNVKDLFDKVNKELEDSCKKDEELKTVVEALEQNSSSEEITVDKETTAPPETTKEQETTTKK